MEATGKIIHAMHIDTVRRADWTSLDRCMPARMEKARRFRFERDRLLCIGAGLLLQRFAGIHDESELSTGPYGKPFSPGGPAFSLSHSGDWCALVTGEDDIGMDIEKTDEKNISVASAVFSSGERDWMEEEPVERFYTLWTLKESLMKAVGLGFRLPPDSFEVLPFLRNEAIDLFGKKWYAAFGGVPGYRFSVSSTMPVGQPVWVEEF